MYLIDPRKIILAVASLAVLCSNAYSQTGYSESDTYKPRNVIPDGKKKEKSGNAAILPVTGNESVTIPISVREKSGRFVTDLAKEDVSIFVDDATVPLKTLQKENGPLNVILALDVSPSLSEDYLKDLINNAIELVRHLPLDTRVTVIEFSSKAKVRCQAVTDRVVLEKCIAKIKAGDGISIYGAIATIYQNVLPAIPGVRKSIVLFTDGVDRTSAKKAYDQSLLAAEKAGVSTIVVYDDRFGTTPEKVRAVDAAIYRELATSGVGTPGGISGTSLENHQRGKDYLSDLIRATGGRNIGFKYFESGTKMLSEELRSRYYAVVDVPKKGFGSRQLRVRINRPNLEVVARGSFVEK